MNKTNGSKRVMVVVACLVLLETFASANPHANAQDEESRLSTSVPSGQIPTGAAFSAQKSIRRMGTLPSGEHRFIRYLTYPALLARDAEGRLRIESVDDPSDECNQLSVIVPPPCPLRSVTVCDPSGSRLIHWAEGQDAGRSAVVVRLSQDQLGLLQTETTVAQSESSSDSQDGESATTQGLGSKLIEGIQATGTRTTFIMHRDRHTESEPRLRIHEVWTSTRLNMIIQIIDGDPQGDLTVSGLEHISLSPDSSLFQPPPGYELQFRLKGADSQYAESDVSRFEDWLVK